MLDLSVDTSHFSICEAFISQVRQKVGIRVGGKPRQVDYAKTSHGWDGFIEPQPVRHFVPSVCGQDPIDFLIATIASKEFKTRDQERALVAAHRQKLATVSCSESKRVCALRDQLPACLVSVPGTAACMGPMLLSEVHVELPPGELDLNP